jgi:hypothetical protein
VPLLSKVALAYNFLGTSQGEHLWKFPCGELPDTIMFNVKFGVTKCWYLQFTQCMLKQYASFWECMLKQYASFWG